jgi:hypothetical protein
LTWRNSKPRMRCDAQQQDGGVGANL